MHLETILNIVLILSIIFNIVGVVYFRRVIPRILFISQNINDLIEIVRTYKAHLVAINQMDAFNGEPVIENLLRHTQSLSILLEDYEDLASISEPLDAEQEEGEIDDEEEEDEIKINEKDVLYAGSRRRDS